MAEDTIKAARHFVVSEDEAEAMACFWALIRGIRSIPRSLEVIFTASGYYGLADSGRVPVHDIVASSVVGRREAIDNLLCSLENEILTAFRKMEAERARSLLSLYIWTPPSVHLFVPPPLHLWSMIAGNQPCPLPASTTVYAFMQCNLAWRTNENLLRSYWL